MARYLKIRNWDKWQSYRSDRGQPPWIKIHRQVMRNYEWLILSDAERGQLVCLWILAADRDGEIPADPRALRKVCSLDSEPDLQRFMELGFIGPDATATSPRRHDDATAAPQSRDRDRVEEECVYPARAREGRVVNPAATDDLDLIRPTDKQVIMLRDKANAAGVDLVEFCEQEGIALVGVNVGKLLAKLEALTPRGSPETFDQAKRRRTDEATAELLKEIAHGPHNGDRTEQGGSDDRLRIEPGSVARLRKGA